MLNNIIFIVVFLSQMLLLSFYFPRIILNRMRYVVRTFPPSEYPKLYPKPIESYKKFHFIFKTLNQLSFIVGFIFIIAIMWSGIAIGEKRSELLPWVYFLIQIIPFIALEVSEFTYFKTLRKADLRTTRKAELKPRRLFDFIPPITFSIVIFMFICSTLFDLYLNQFNFKWSSGTFLRFVILTACNLFFAGIAFWIMLGKKLDPYQASDDRIKQITASINSMAYVSIGLSMYLMIREGIDEFNLDYLLPGIMSLYCQLIALVSIGTMLRTLQIQNINFDVYKENEPTG